MGLGGAHIGDPGVLPCLLGALGRVGQGGAGDMRPQRWVLTDCELLGSNVQLGGALAGELRALGGGPSTLSRDPSAVGCHDIDGTAIDDRQQILDVT